MSILAKVTDKLVDSLNKIDDTNRRLLRATKALKEIAKYADHKEFHPGVCANVALEDLETWDLI